MIATLEGGTLVPAGDRGGIAVELHPLVRLEWRDEHLLSKRSVLWIHDHADPGDLSPVITAIAQLRAEHVDRLNP